MACAMGGGGGKRPSSEQPRVCGGRDKGDQGAEVHACSDADTVTRVFQEGVVGGQKAEEELQLARGRRHGSKGSRCSLAHLWGARGSRSKGGVYKKGAL